MTRYTSYQKTYRNSVNWPPGTMKTSYRYVVPLGSKKPLLIRYECSIPVFDGLFLEEDNRSIGELLFLLATWHTYGKLRLHTDTTLGMLETVTKALCQALRHFATVICPWYTTKELPREVRARLTCQQAQAMRRSSKARNTTSNSRPGKVKWFNMSTYKMHRIPNYLDAIRKHGTTDSYSTQTVCHVRFIMEATALYITERACTPPVQDVVQVIQ
jgi:hypothetical protein